VKAAIARDIAALRNELTKQRALDDGEIIDLPSPFLRKGRNGHVA
jgi:hypothetical protein